MMRTNENIPTKPLKAKEGRSVVKPPRDHPTDELSPSLNKMFCLLGQWVLKPHVDVGLSCARASLIAFACFFIFYFLNSRCFQGVIVL